jgi:hypothetical protein
MQQETINHIKYKDHRENLQLYIITLIQGPLKEKKTLIQGRTSLARVEF